jgi:putative transposase
MGDMEIPDELIDQLLGEYQGPEQLTGPDGLMRRLIERTAGVELEQHLGYSSGGEPPEGQPNRRNGTTSKTLRTQDGPVAVELPRDREGSFEPRIVPMHGRSFDGFDEQILALYAGGMSTRDIQRHLRELYGVDVSEGLISEVTGSIQDDVRAWQTRPLEELYVVVYLDAMQVSVRDQQVVRKKAVYVAVGVTLEGERDCLGLWIEKSEGARFWTSVLTDLRNRGVKDVLFVCTDGLSGFPEAIDAVFPQAVNQTCIVHLVRQSLRYLSWKERKSCAAELRRIYTAADADAAREVLDELGAAWADSRTRTAALAVWDRAWERVISLPRFPRGDPADHLHDQQRREPAHAGPQDDQDQRTLPQRGRRAPTDLARDHARQNDLANLLQLDASDGSPTHPLRRPHPRQHLTTHRYTEKRAGSPRAVMTSSK